MFLIEVIHLDFLGYEVVVVVGADLLAVEVDQAGDYDDLLFHGEVELGGVVLELHQGEREELLAGGGGDRGGGRGKGLGLAQQH